MWEQSEGVNLQRVLYILTSGAPEAKWESERRKPFLSSNLAKILFKDVNTCAHAWRIAKAVRNVCRTTPERSIWRGCNVYSERTRNSRVFTFTCFSKRPLIRGEEDCYKFSASWFRTWLSLCGGNSVAGESSSILYRRLSSDIRSEIFV